MSDSVSYATDPEARFGWCIRCVLDPNTSWFETYYDIKRRLFLITAGRVYLRIDEPNGVLTDEADAFISRIEADDPDIVVLPRLSDDARSRLVAEFIESRPLGTRIQLEQHWSERVLSSWRPNAIDSWLYEATEDLELLKEWERFSTEFCTPYVRKFLTRYGINLAETAIVDLLV
jgi:hypothetical protein